MKRLLAIVVLLGIAVSVSAWGMSETDKERYRKELKKYLGEYSLALAIDADGGWAWNGARDPGGAKIKALASCREYSKNPYTCKIVDVDGNSEFISQRGSSSYSSTVSSSSSGKVWCGTKNEVTRVTKYVCEFNQGGKAFETQSQASAFRNKLRAESSSYSSTASSKKKVWCATKYAAWSSVKGCRSGVKAFSTEAQAKAEHKRLKGGSSSYSSTASSKEKVWCATKYAAWGSVKGCRSGVKAFSTEAQAKAEHQRLKAASTSTASTSTASSSSASAWKMSWCATSKSVWYALESSCRSSSGTPYTSKEQAQAEHKRLKAKEAEVSKPVVKTASLTIRSNVAGDKVYIDDQFKGSTRLDLDLPQGKDYTIRIEKDGYETYEETIKLTDNLIIRGNIEKVAEQPVQAVAVQTTTADRSALELAFWQAIQDSDDPDMFRAYIDQFPDGVYTGLAKLKIKKLKSGPVNVATVSSSAEPVVVAKPKVPDHDYGKYYALVIGNNGYTDLPRLRTALNDARAVSDLLETGYGFKVELLEDATRSEIVKSIYKLKGKVGGKDNLLIYYAGHGYLDPDTDEGYWLPVDATDDDDVNWIMTDSIVSKIRGMDAKHVMVVADSCFSGAITRAIKISHRTPDNLAELVKLKARTALTSGGLEPVTDSGSGGGHSVFAESFMSILRDNDSVLDGSELFARLKPRVEVNSKQTPEYGNIREAGHGGGDFLFVRR